MIHVIPGLRLAQAYLLSRPEGLAVIDPGYTGSHRAVLGFMSGLGFQQEDLRWVILTHHHVDHAGSSLELCRQTGASLAVHADDAPYLNRGRPRNRMTGWGCVDWLPVSLARFIVTCAGNVAVLLREGDSIAGLRVIHAPGHTPGSICLWSPEESAVFVGDVLNHQRGLQRPPWPVNSNHGKARVAARALVAFRYDRAYFGHGPAITQCASDAISRYIESWAPRARSRSGSPQTTGRV